ncbi:MAG TPA: hypothetical protein DEB39_04005 [Planctomycetaceae bacterium]|nr:hypothetical protein [Planctomycetaceae bacterium]
MSRKPNREWYIWERDENGHSVQSACRTHVSQRHYRKLLKRIVRAAGDCAREHFQAVCGIPGRSV